MGEVEQTRMATPGSGKIEQSALAGSLDVEAALVRSVETAQRNLDHYRARTNIVDSRPRRARWLRKIRDRF